jgi:hypothetical protein
MVRDAGQHATELVAAATRDSDNIRRAAAVYREQVLAGIDHNKDVVAELLDAFSRIREHISKSEKDALDITAHLHERRSELSEAIVDMRQVPEVESAARIERAQLFDVSPSTYTTPATPAPTYEAPLLETPAYEAPAFETPAYEPLTFEPPTGPVPVVEASVNVTESLYEAPVHRSADDVRAFIDRIVDEVNSEDRY